MNMVGAPYLCTMNRMEKQKNLLLIDDKVISEEVVSERFACDLSRCKGACCVEGELGAPLEISELEILRRIEDKVKPYLTPKGKRAIEEQGPYVLDITGDYSTPLVSAGKECAYTVFNENGIALCAIEKAYREGVIDFQKPISCHLYPIRVHQGRKLEALNYDEWSICKPACASGKIRGIRVYEFVKDAIIRKYGVDFYEALDQAVKVRENGNRLSTEGVTE